MANNLEMQDNYQDPINTWFAKQLAKTAAEASAKGVDGSVEENDLTLRLFNDADISGEPYLIFTTGAPGSGKSSVLDVFLRDSHLNPKPVRLAFDSIMEAYPGYRETYERQGKEAAFARYELKARATGFDLMHRLLLKGASIAFDNGGGNPAYVDLYDAVSRLRRHRLVHLQVNCPLDVCIERAIQRDRFVPPQSIKRRYDAIEELRSQYNELADLVIIIDNGNDLPEVVPMPQPPVARLGLAGRKTVTPEG